MLSQYPNEALLPLEINDSVGFVAAHELVNTPPRGETHANCLDRVVLHIDTARARRRRIWLSWPRWYRNLYVTCRRVWRCDPLQLLGALSLLVLAYLALLLVAHVLGVAAVGVAGWMGLLP
jgi:hypothetical protein